MAATPSRDLAIYLLKADSREPEEHVPKRRTLKRFEVGKGTGKVGILFVQRTKTNPPRWAKLFDEFIDEGDLGKTSSSSAIFLVKADGWVFALAFGQGRYLLEPDCWEERFGLRVALNSISANRLRSVDKVTFDALSTHTRTQSSREASATEFGLDIELDLVRAVTGIPNDEALGRRITGMDALHASVRVDLKGLRGFFEGTSNGLRTRPIKRHSRGSITSPQSAPKHWSALLMRVPARRSTTPKVVVGCASPRLSIGHGSLASGSALAADHRNCLTSFCRIF